MQVYGAGELQLHPLTSATDVGELSASHHGYPTPGEGAGWAPDLVWMS